MPKWPKAIFTALALTALAGCATLPDLCSYAYQPWGPCEAGFQTRVFSSAPSGCVGLPMAVRACEPVPVDPPPVPVPEPPPAPEPPEEPTDSSFLWKPISDGDGKLAVLTPHYRECVTVRAKGEAGVYRGRGNGNRQHWRFSKPGGKYGGNIRVICTEANGLEVVWVVPKGGQRYQAR